MFGPKKGGEDGVLSVCVAYTYRTYRSVDARVLPCMCVCLCMPGSLKPNDSEGRWKGKVLKDACICQHGYYTHTLL